MRRQVAALPASVWVLGLGSLLMDVSSELIHCLLPMFMATTLGASAISIGLVEGIAEGTASITKLFSGALSDRLRHRKGIIVLGYGLAAFTKPIFPLATSMTWVFVARFVDRIGKGIRGAPRDALIADVTAPEHRGAAFGLRQALDSAGAFLGPALAIFSLSLFADDLQSAMWMAVPPALLCVLLLGVAVREPERKLASTNPPRIQWSAVRDLGAAYWTVSTLGAIFTLARFSEAFLILKARHVGIPMTLVPVVLIVMNVVYAAAAYPAGAAADRMKPRHLLLAGLSLLVVSDAVLALAANAWQVYAGTALWGLHMALTQGLFAKLVADHAPADLRGTAFGMFNLISGVALLLASLLAGWLWESYGPAMTFLGGAVLAVLTTIGLLFSSDRGPVA